MKPAIGSIIMVFTCLIAVVKPALAISKRQCSRLLLPDATTIAAQPSTAAFINLLRTLSAKSTANADALLRRVIESPVAFDPTSNALGLTAHDRHVFGIALRKLIADKTLQWDLVKQTAEDLLADLTKTQHEASQAKIDTKSVFGVIDTPFAKSLSIQSKLAHFESSRGLRYVAFFEEIDGKTFTKVFSDATGESHEFRRNNLDYITPEFFEMPDGSVYLVTTEPNGVGVFNVETGERKANIPLLEQARLANAGSRPNNEAEIRQLIPYLSNAGELNVMVVWARNVDKKNGLLDRISRIETKTEAAVLLPRPFAQHLYSRSLDQGSIYAVATIRNGLEVTVSVDDIANETKPIYSKTIALHHENEKPGLLLSKNTKTPYLSIRHDSLTVVNLRTGDAFVVEHPPSGPLEFYEDRSGDAFLLFDPRFTRDKKFLALDLRNETVIELKPDRLQEKVEQWFLAQSPKTGPVLFWRRNATETCALELETGVLNSLKHHPSALLEDVYETRDGRIELMQLWRGQAVFKQIFGPFSEGNGAP